MFYDIHAHICTADFPEFASRCLGRPNFDVDVLLRRMDMEGIEKSVVLPLINAECLDIYGVAGNHETIAACRKHPDRLIPFCGIDPRNMAVWGEKESPLSMYNLISIYRDLGCRGIGEYCGSIPVDDERNGTVYTAAAELQMPILFHFQPHGGHSYGTTDDFHLPGLARVLAKYPETIFIGHSMTFWSELSGDITEAERELYLTKPYKKKGVLWQLMAEYPNLSCDISAGSGAFALRCDPVKGAEFLERYQDRIYFGTDRFTSIDEPLPPQLDLLNSWKSTGSISDGAYEKITHKNLAKLINI